MSNPVTNLSNKSTQIENPSEINIHRGNKYVSDLSIQGESLASAKPDNNRIPCKNKGKKTPESLIIRREHIGDTVNHRKIPKEDTVTDVEKCSLYKKPPHF